MKGPWVAGVLANNVWSGWHFGTRRHTPQYVPHAAVPNYNFGDGWYVGSSPIITANWLTAGDKAWTMPVGADIGRA